MSEFLLIKDTLTDKSLQIVRQFPNPDYVVINNNELIDVKRASIGKVIRAWMKEVKKKPL